MDWHLLERDEVLERLSVRAETGLGSEEAARRLVEHGPNELAQGRADGWLALLVAQFRSSLIALLLGAAALSLALGETADALAILVILLLNAALGFSQDSRAERAMAALSRLAVPTVRVRRDGQARELSARELVPGDLLLLEPGCRVPADGRLVESVNLHALESALTGEALPVAKSVERLPAGDRALGDRINCLYLGTTITQGHGVAVVTGTGMATELGRIAGMLVSLRREPTPLQRRLAAFGRRITVVALGLVGLVFAVGLLTGSGARLALLTAMSLAVAAVPEGLPAVATVCLALGGRRLLAREALIRKLPAVETLGAVTVICSDKTGTLTENRMTVTVMDVAGERLVIERSEGPPADHRWPELVEAHPPLALMLIAGTLCNDALASLGDEIIGDPTEAAFVRVARELGLAKAELEGRCPRVGERSFDSARKRMTTAHRLGPGPWTALGLRAGELVAFSKGGVDEILSVCTRAFTGAESEPLGEELRARIACAHADLAGRGMRVLGFAFRRLESVEDCTEAELERELVFVGMMGLHDPPRAGARDSVARCRAAGIRPVMITGDHPLTAGVIAAELGIDATKGIVTGTELARADERELARLCREVSVFARVAPEHKLAIVEALQAQGEVVAMTGDGVNDAPALKRADIGIAMGLVGTDVAREAADMVLLDDDFTTIVGAVEEGRIIHDNIAKFIRYTLTSNAGEIWVMLLGPLFGMPLALLPLQVLWVNLVTDGLPGLALSVEPGEPDAMTRPPRGRSESFLTANLVRHLIWVSLLMGAISLGIGWTYWRGGATTAHWRTMVFTVLTLSQLGHALAVRSQRLTLARLGPFSNPLLLASVLLTLGLQLALIYAEPLRRIFHLARLSAADLAIALAASTGVFLAVEASKVVARWRRPA